MWDQDSGAIETVRENQPLRILQIIGKTCGGGVEAVVMNYYRHMDRTKIQFDFVIDEDSPVKLDEEISRLGGRVYNIVSYAHNLPHYTAEITRIVRAGHYEIVHSHMNTLAVFSLLAAWLGGATVRIVHNHTIANRSEFLRSCLKYALRPFARTFANAYLACGEKAARWMFGAVDVAAGRVRIVRNAIDMDAFFYREDVRQNYRKMFGIAPDAFVVGHIGRFVHTKNHEFLIDMFRELRAERPNAVLLLVGDGPLFLSLREKVRREGAEDAVFFLGLRNDAAELYNVMDVFVLPSWYEGLPVVAVEAQANGLPCLVSDYVSWECRLTRSLEFLSLKESARAWASRTLGLATGRNPTACEELAYAGFDIKEEAPRLAEFYEDLAKSVPHGSLQGAMLESTGREGR